MVGQVYVDYLVFSRTIKEHVKHFRSVFQSFRKFSTEKSLWELNEINFLGHTIRKVDPIHKMAIPRDVGGIRSLNYYKSFVTEIAECLVPLNNVLKKGIKVVVTPAIENNIRRESLLAFPDFAKQFTVATDACEYVFGAV